MLAAAVTNMLAGILVHQLIRQRTAFLILRKMLGLYGLVQVLQTAVGERWLLASLDNCQSGVWTAGASIRFGGAYTGIGAMAETGCGVANPQTGWCSCPLDFFRT